MRQINIEDDSLHISSVYLIVCAFAQQSSSYDNVVHVTMLGFDHASSERRLTSEAMGFNHLRQFFFVVLVLPVQSSIVLFCITSCLMRLDHQPV